MEPVNKIRHVFNGEEYTTRVRLCEDFNVTKSNMQYFLENTPDIPTIQELNKVYYLKSDAEQKLTAWLQHGKRKTVRLF